MHAHSTTVAELMTPEPMTLAPSQPMSRAADEMRLSGIRHLPIVDRDGQLVGVLSDRDVLTADPECRIADVMTKDLVTIAPDAAAHEAAYLLLRHSIGCVPVVDGGGRLVGILTEFDLVRVAYTLLGGQVPIDQLEDEEREAENL